MLVGNPVLLFARVFIMIRVTWAKMIHTFPTLGAGFHTPDGSHCRRSRAYSLCIQTPIISDAIKPGLQSWVHHAASIPSSSSLITRLPEYPPLTSPQGPTSLPQPTGIKFYWLPRMCGKAWIWTFAEGPNPHIKLHITNIPILAVHSISNSEFPKLDSNPYPDFLSTNESFAPVYVVTDPEKEWTKTETHSQTVALFHHPKFYVSSFGDL